MYFHTPFFNQRFKGQGISAVAVQAVGFLDKHDAAGGIALQQLQHAAEFLAAWILGRLHIDEFALNVKTARAGIFGQQLALRRNGITFTLLLTTGNTRIRYRWDHRRAPPWNGFSW